jgi:hypothetical protein
MKKAENLHLFFFPSFSVLRDYQLFGFDRLFRFVSEIIHYRNKACKILCCKLDNQIKVCCKPYNSMQNKSNSSGNCKLISRFISALKTSS